jgi:release factor glutamine methyltransferase
MLKEGNFAANPTFDAMTIRDSFQAFLKRLTPLYTEREARYVADLAFEKATGFTRLDRLTRPDAEVTGRSQKVLDDSLSLLLDSVPVQYVIREAWFYKLPFYVNEQVLIPRPETEELVSWIIEEMKPKIIQPAHDVTQPIILDIGTGSGCIAIALKKALPAARVMALDTSAPALEVARVNAVTHQAAIEFTEADILNEDACAALPSLDIIVSNPPYIPWKEKKELQAQVADHEPSGALFVPDQDPFLFYKAILETARRRLALGGSIFVEIHQDFGQQVAALFERYGFERVIRQDMSGHDRMVRGVRRINADKNPINTIIC